jgi:hypothetical protein
VLRIEKLYPGLFNHLPNKVTSLTTDDDGLVRGSVLEAWGSRNKKGIWHPVATKTLTLERQVRVHKFNKRGGILVRKKNERVEEVCLSQRDFRR